MKNIIRLFALLLIFTLSLIAIRASQAQLYMVLKQGASGLDFYCANTAPYADIAAQSEAEYTPFALHPEALQLKAQVIQVSDCNLDNIYANDGGYLFAWRFTQRVTDDHSDHRHFTRGAAWIRLLDFGQE